MSENITINGNEYNPEVVSAGVNLFRESMNTNARGINPTRDGGLGGADVSSDATITRWLGQQYGGDRDIHKVLGYPSLDDNTALERYRARYEYQDIAARIIDEFPKETWKNPPKVVDEGKDETTEFERVTNNIIESELTSYLERLDRAQRLGEYGVMVVGYADGQDRSEPVNESAIDSVDDITYFNIFPQEQVESWELGKESNEYPKEPTDERYNKPVRYYVDFGDVDAESTDDDFEWVHWSRVVPHAAEGALETDLKGEPALKKIFYRLVDREKVVGASAEMFWSGADEKIIANVNEDFALQQYEDSGEREDFQEQLESLLHDMQKYIVSTGMEYEVIGGQEVDPSGVIDTIDSSIAAAIGMPKNKLQGNETGERATSMDRNNWFDNISSRQSNFAGPRMVRPVIERWLSFGILPDPVGDDFGIKFPDLFEQTESDKAEVESQRASTLQASGLAMTLSSEEKMQFIEGGPDAVDMEKETRELPVNEDDERVQEAFHSLNQGVDTSPPQQAQTNAQAVLDIREKTDAMTDTGWRRARQLADGDELSEGVIQKMAQFKRHQSNTEYENYSDIPESKKSGENPWWEDNGTVAWLGWGGTSGVEWAVEQSDALTENTATQGRFEPGYFGLNFDPVKHPRNPETGQFVERPYPVPDEISGLDTKQMIGELAAANDDFAEQVEGLAVDIPGDDDEGSNVPTEIKELIDNPDAGTPGTGDYELKGFEENRNNALVKGVGEDISISTIRQTEYGPKAKLNTPFEAKKDIKDLSWEDTHRTWNSKTNTWDVDASELDNISDELVDKGYRIKITGGAKEEVTAPSVDVDASPTEKLQSITTGDKVGLVIEEGGQPRGPFTITERTRDGAKIAIDGNSFGTIKSGVTDENVKLVRRGQDNREIADITFEDS